MRVSFVLVVSGEAIALTGVGLWSLPLALVLLGVQLLALGLLRDGQLATQPAARVRRPNRIAAGVHRRRASLRTWVTKLRPAFRLARGVAS